MDENIEMINFMHKNAEMGYLSSLDVLNQIKETDNKIKRDLDLLTSEYKKYMDESKRIIKKSKTSISKNSLFTKVSSKMGIEMELNKDNSDSAIARMLIQGLTMGEVDIESKINNYKENLDNNILTLAEKYKNFQHDFIHTFKKYL